jgi:hypothetical protein
MTYIRMCNQTNTTGATSGAGTAYPSGAPEFTPGFVWGSCYSVFSFICMLRRLLFVLLSFFDIRILITPFGIFKLFFLLMMAIRVNKLIDEGNSCESINFGGSSFE